MSERQALSSADPEGATATDAAPRPGRQADLTEGKVSTHLVKLTGNMVMGMVSVMSASLMEAVYVGQVGTRDLAAVSFTFPVVMILQGVAMGLSVGASSVVAGSVSV